MQAYAPLLVNVNPNGNGSGATNLIGFNNARAATPRRRRYVQGMFAANKPGT